MPLILCCFHREYYVSSYNRIWHRQVDAAADLLSLPFTRLPYMSERQLRPSYVLSFFLKAMLMAKDLPSSQFFTMIRQNVILDTGSSDFWLVDNNCTSVDCAEVRTFAANVSSSSTTTARDFTIRYGMVSYLCLARHCLAVSVELLTYVKL